MSRNTNTTKDRLIGYSFLLISISFLICLMTLLFSCIYNYKYQQEFNQMSSFCEYWEKLDQCMANLKLYMNREDNSYYDSAQKDYHSAMESINYITTLIQEAELYYAAGDIIHMTESLGAQMEQIQTLMGAYHDDSMQDFTQIRDAYTLATDIYASIEEEYMPTNRLMLDEVNLIQAKMQKKNLTFLLCLLLLFAAVIVILTFEIRTLSKTITLPIFALTVEAKKIRNGNFDDVKEVTIPEKADDEISVLAEVFNDMSKKIAEHIHTVEENARVRQELADSKFKELQAQINPHFLFNTLNMIAETAYLENADKTASLLQHTGKMLRFSLDLSGKTVTLYRELEELGNYVMIQEQRYGDRIQFNFELDERFHDASIPALTLQPLVENAIIHGIGMKTSGAEIWIRTIYDKPNQQGILVVEDNGAGISADKLAAVSKEMTELSERSAKIGLSNVFLRLHMLYSDRFSMKIYSQENCGTKLEIRIPYEMR